MSSPVFVLDAQGTPLMPTSAAYARRLLKHGKARWRPHHALPVIQLSQVVSSPALRPIVAGIKIHLHTAELLIVAAGERGPFPLLHIVVDLRTDMPVRLRRRAGHRRRRRARGRYRPIRRHGLPFKLRRPSMARSAWGRVSPPRRERHTPSISTFSPTIRWRAQAIVRVFAALKSLLPISHAIILSPAKTGEPPHKHQSQQTLRQQLIEVYGRVAADGHRVAQCAYCGTTEGHIEVEHILPVARGGTDGWHNRVLACAACNARKGNRTPEEASMQLLVVPSSKPAQQNRAGVYARWTARALAVQAEIDMPVHWQRPEQIADVSAEVTGLFATLLTSPPSLPLTIAKPIGRPSKQVFSSRNYPLSTAITTGFVRVKQTLKRRLQINLGLAVTDQMGRRRTQVVRADEGPKAQAARVVKLGMLCEAMRNNQAVIGIVAAIHSTGRLTLLVPEAVRKDSIGWRRVAVSPRQRLRILTSDRAVFLPWATSVSEE